MKNYTIYCTPEQTKKSLELGAPLNSPSVISMDDKKNKENHIVHCMKGKPVIMAGNFIIPTAEQMIAWLEEQGQSIEVSRLYRNNPNWSAFVDDTQIIGKYYPTRKEAILAAIDTALEHLIEIHQ